MPEAADFISHQIDLNGAENVSLYADSAGTAIAISAVRELLLAGKPVPSSMVLLSLTADGTLSNPDIREVDDPLFDVDNAEDGFDSHWLDGITDRRDPLVSPLFFETEILKALPPTTIYVGEREILYPDTLFCNSAQSRRARRYRLSSARGWSTTGRRLGCRSFPDRGGASRYLPPTGYRRHHRRLCTALPTTSSDWPAWRG